MSCTTGGGNWTAGEQPDNKEDEDSVYMAGLSRLTKAGLYGLCRDTITTLPERAWASTLNCTPRQLPLNITDCPDWQLRLQRAIALTTIRRMCTVMPNKARCLRIKPITRATLRCEGGVERALV